MADSAVFEWVADALERKSGLSRLQARGTLRLALQDVGLESVRFAAGQARVVLERVLPDQLRARGVAEADAVCAALVEELAAAELPAPALDSPEAFVERARKR